MNRGDLSWMAVAFASSLFCACSLALDFEALERGDGDSGEDTVARQCTLAADCDDGIDCTQDRCGENGSCLEPLPDDDACEHLEMCKRGQGCIPTEDECEVSLDCDDGIACTRERCELGMCFHVPKHDECDASDPSA
ncbi:MAG: hypothetical protein MUC50_04065 [Myxococcota bacterium]|jgi:hypothetical protein|nr:hypothetical protein [Myxococcota bacterium]